MLKINEKEIVANLEGGIALRSDINKIVDQINDEGYSNICWIGIGGTYASSMQAVVHMKERTKIETLIY